MLDYALSSDLSALKKGKSQATTIATPKGTVKGVLTCVDANTYQLEMPPAKAGLVGTWLRDLSDGYTSFNLDGEKDFSAARMPGPFVVMDVKKKNVKANVLPLRSRTASVEKPWFIGQPVEVQERSGRKAALPMGGTRRRDSKMHEPA